MLRRALSLLLLLALGGCASVPPGPQRLEPYGTVELTAVPFYPQQRFQCGPASLAMVLNWGGLATDPDQLTDSLFIPSREGTLQPELIAQARRHGRLAYQIPANPDALLTELEAGHPVLVLQNLALRWSPVWHYAVAIGFDAGRQEMILRSGTTERHTLPLRTFLHTWRRGGNWGLVVLPPDKVPASAGPEDFLAAAYELERSGQADAARSAYQAGLSRWPGQAELSLALANLQYADGDRSAAAATLRRSAQSGSASGPVYNNLALVLAELGRWEEAEQAASAATLKGGPHAEEFQDTLRQVRCRSAGGCAE